MINLRHFSVDALSETMLFRRIAVKIGGRIEAKEMTAQEVSASTQMDIDELRATDIYHAGT